MTSTAESRVAELTDKAIVKRIAAIDRAVDTRRTNIAGIQVEIDDLTGERAQLVEIQIERLRAQLPKSRSDE